MRSLGLLLSVLLFSVGGFAKSPSRLGSSLVFHAPFDTTPDAVIGGGDRRFQTGPKWDGPRKTEPGLPTNGAVWVDPRAGRHGGALRFEKKIPQLVGFRVAGKPTNWGIFFSNRRAPP